MSVIAKFSCQSVTDFGASKEITLAAVHSDNGENKSWSKYTPSGKLVMTITNPEAFEQFKPGQSYYLTFKACAPAAVAAE